VYIEASWALNVSESREAATTLCGTLGGAEIRSGMSYQHPELIYNSSRHGQLTDEKAASGGAVAYFDGKKDEPGVLESKGFFDAILTNGKPLVDPEQAYVVTQILEGIYKSAETGKEVFF
jgi:predicted dehydrogenase